MEGERKSANVGMDGCEGSAGWDDAARGMKNERIRPERLATRGALQTHLMALTGFPSLFSSIFPEGTLECPIAPDVSFLPY